LFFSFLFFISWFTSWSLSDSFGCRFLLFSELFLAPDSLPWVFFRTPLQVNDHPSPLSSSETCFSASFATFLSPSFYQFSFPTKRCLVMLPGDFPPPPPPPPQPFRVFPIFLPSFPRSTFFFYRSACGEDYIPVLDFRLSRDLVIPSISTSFSPMVTCDLPFPPLKSSRSFLSILPLFFFF